MGAWNGLGRVITVPRCSRLSPCCRRPIRVERRLSGVRGAPTPRVISEADAASGRLRRSPEDQRLLSAAPVLDFAAVAARAQGHFRALSLTEVSPAHAMDGSTMIPVLRGTIRSLLIRKWQQRGRRQRRQRRQPAKEGGKRPRISRLARESLPGRSQCPRRRCSLAA